VVAGPTPLADYRYGHDAAGNITAITDALDARFGRNFGYDDLYRLTRADTGTALWGNATYTYDAMGNRLAHTIGSRTSSYAYVGSTSKLSSVTENGQTQSVMYDPAGNEETVGGAPFAYSPRNSLDRAAGLRYVYDGTGVRVAQVGLSVGPIITEQPQSRPICPGASTTLTVRASGANAYRWESSADGTNWSAVAGATASNVTVAPSAPTHYRAIASNAAASTTSNVAIITPAPLATEPSSGIVYGDLTRDGLVNAVDMAALRSVLAGTQPLPVPTVVADLNGDGTVDALDLALLSGYSTSAITCLPQFPALLSATAPSPSSAAFTSAAPAQAQASSNPTQYFFYSPEKQLLSETELKAGGGAPQVAVDYIWFAGRPVAEEKTASDTFFTLTDHLGTPFLQTTPDGATRWRAEYEPFGTVWTMRNGTSAGQRLRFPGQEFDEQTPERAYNIFRWYRSGWGRYTSADPLAPGGLGHFDRGRMSRFATPFAAARDRFMRENATVSNPALVGMSSMGRRPSPPALSDATNPYAYAADSPVMYTDPLGLAPCLTMAINPISGYVPAGPPGKTFKGCQYIGQCYGWLAVYEKQVELDCKCKDFCLISIDPATAIPNGPTICFNTPPWWTWAPPLINP
jgi:RHS repeat-associated protein